MMNSLNKFKQFAISTFLLIVLKWEHSIAYPLNTNNVNNLGSRQSPPKASPNAAVPVMNSKLPVVLPPNIISDYYNSLLMNGGQFARQYPQYQYPIQSWQQSIPEYMPLPNAAPEEYEDGDDFVDDNMSDAYYGNGYQPEGWFNGPVIYDKPDSNIQLDDAQFNALMMSYLFDQLEKLDKQKESATQKREETPKKQVPLPKWEVSAKSTAATPLETTVKPTQSTQTPLKLTAKQFPRLFRGQKEFPLLRPSSDSNDKTQRSQASLAWPSELDENNIREEESLMSLKQSKGQSRVARDVLTAQLDNLKREPSDKAH